MSEKLNNLLKNAYKCYENHENPPIPLKTIKEYLELEGVLLDDFEEGVE